MVNWNVFVAFHVAKIKCYERNVNVREKKYNFFMRNVNFQKLKKHIFEKTWSNESSMCSTKEGFVRVTVMKSETIELVRWRMLSKRMWNILFGLYHSIWYTNIIKHIQLMKYCDKVWDNCTHQVKKSFIKK